MTVPSTEGGYKLQFPYTLGQTQASWPWNHTIFVLEANERKPVVVDQPYYSHLKGWAWDHGSEAQGSWSRKSTEEKSLTWLGSCLAWYSRVSEIEWIYHSSDIISHDLYNISVLPAVPKSAVFMILSTPSFSQLLFPRIPTLPTFSWLVFLVLKGSPIPTLLKKLLIILAPL